MSDLNAEIPSVVAIVVTWNKKKDVLKLLDQLKGIHYPAHRLEVVVVDNHSTDGTAEAVESSYPSVGVIRNRENLGGAGGFNTGMRWALENRPDADYLWLLDNDVLVDEDALQELVRVMEKNPQAAVCGSKIINSENHNDLIELGAFIDYDYGDIRRNLPDPKELRNPNAVFEVDYVAACSLLARVRSVKEVGVWHDKFFIYWDDMEWGARFNAAGYKVLASNASVVYHPSWAGRTADNSAIWRNYYRTRNSLWFFNHYCTGLKRRLLLARMVVRFMAFAASACMRSQSSLSTAFTEGVGDFLTDRYGRREFAFPANDLEGYLRDGKHRAVCLWVFDTRMTREVIHFIGPLMKKYPALDVLALVPQMDEHLWKDLSGKAQVVSYRKKENGALALVERLKMVNLLRERSWSLFLAPPIPPRIGCLWGKDVARIDFASGKTVGIEKVSGTHLFRIPFLTLTFLFWILILPPTKEKSFVR